MRRIRMDMKAPEIDGKCDSRFSLEKNQLFDVFEKSVNEILRFDVKFVLENRLVELEIHFFQSSL